MKTIDDPVQKSLTSGLAQKDSLRLSLGNLPNFGISVLTGEVCPYGLRFLCDLSSQGVTLLQDMLSVEIKTTNQGANATIVRI